MRNSRDDAGRVMLKVRIVFSKRGRACFIPHIALPAVFSRSATRAGIRFVQTEGFSPRPKLSLGPELPVGIVALCEPMDVWLEEWRASFFDSWQRKLPDGFSLGGWEEAPLGNLGNSCEGAEYLIRVRDGGACEAVRSGYPWPEWVCRADYDGEWFRVVTERPGEHGPGALIRDLVEFGKMSGWAGVNVVRRVVGRLSGGELTGEKRVLPLVSFFSGDTNGN